MENGCTQPVLFMWQERGEISHPTSDCHPRSVQPIRTLQRGHLHNIMTTTATNATPAVFNPQALFPLHFRAYLFSRTSSATLSSNQQPRLKVQCVMLSALCCVIPITISDALSLRPLYKHLSLVFQCGWSEISSILCKLGVQQYIWKILNELIPD